jgi:hypothetical protein
MVLASCGAPAALREPPFSSAPFCVSMTAEREGRAHFTRACTDTLPLCVFVRDRAIAFAGIAHISEVGQCRVEARR